MEGSSIVQHSDWPGNGKFAPVFASKWDKVIVP